MAHASITGTMGPAIAAVVTKGGNTADLIGHGDVTALTGDVVVPAVPSLAVADVMATRGEELAGTVVGITNSLDVRTFDSRRSWPTSSSPAGCA